MVDLLGKCDMENTNITKASDSKTLFINTVTNDLLTNLHNITLAVELLRLSNQQWTQAQKQSLDLMQSKTDQMFDLIPKGIE
jgi:hypothetical protein